MRKSFPIFALSILFAFSAFGQDSSPVATPTPDDGDIVRISTNLIQLDVSVTDKKGKIITDLRPEEIEIYENGKRQEISNFSFVSNIRTLSPSPSKKDKKSAVPIPPGMQPKPEQVRRTVALVVDDLTLSFESTFWVKEALRKFVDEQMQDGDLVAIIRTGAGIGALQQFTTDKRQLLAAIKKIRFNLSGRGRTGVFNPIEPTLREQLNGTVRSGGSVTDLGDAIDADRSFERETNEFRESIFASGTLGAINFIIRGMTDLPGRKSIMLLSDGFSLVSRNERGVPQGGSHLFDSLRRLTDLANRASVVVYTIDPRGLVAPGLTAQDNTWGLSADQVDARLQDRRNELFDTQEGLTYLARQTGGFAILNQNDISWGIRRVLDDQSYYLIGYQPDDETFDPKMRRYNKLEIKVKRDGARVRYRSGFFGITDEQIQKPKLNASQSLLNALTSPFAVNDISLRLNALFIAGEKKSLLLRSYLHVDADDLKFSKEPDGTYKTTFELVAIGFGDNGVPVDEYSKGYTINVKEDAYQRIREKGFVYYFTFPVKKPGGYQLRVAIRDSVGNKVGSANQFVEIPNLKKNRLTLSGVVFESMALDDWQRLSSDVSSYAEIKKTTDPMTDTSQRQFQNGSVLRYGVEIYNAKLDGARKSSLTSQIRIFRDGKKMFESRPTTVSQDEIAGSQSISLTGGLVLTEKMSTGDYVLQVIVTDNLAKEKRKIASQFVQFEVVE